jgi:hypothetical protein
MRRFLGLTAGILFLASCSESTNPSLLDSFDTELPTLTVASEIFDGSSGDPAANPFFFFLPDIAASDPGDVGAPETGLSPTVTVCPISAWDEIDESCSSALVTFSTQADQFGNAVSESPPGDYTVPLKPTDYPYQAGEIFRVAVDVSDQVLGWADLKAYDRILYCEDDDDYDDDDDDENECFYRSLPRVDSEGYVVLPTFQDYDISFRIAEGALEAEYCDLTNIEDCDVEIFTYEETGCLRVFEKPGAAGETLGSQACVPANAAELNGVPVEGEYAVILTLEEGDQFQGGAVPASAQVPFFPDLTTDPPGIEFNVSSEGVGVVICQAPVESGGIPDELHEQLRPFIVYSDGETVFPGRDEFSFGAPECEGFVEHPHTAAAGPNEGTGKGFLGRFAAGLSKASSFLLPSPLHARRLHGGLNTTVYDTRRSPSDNGEGDNAPAQMPIEQTQETFVVEFGAVLDVDPSRSVASFSGPGQVGVETTITVNVLNAQGLPVPFDVSVDLTVSSGTEEFQLQADPLGGGIYRTKYTPNKPGVDEIDIFIDGMQLGGASLDYPIAPRPVDVTQSSFEVSYSEVGSTTTVTVEVRDTNGDLYTSEDLAPLDVQILVTGPNGTTVPATAQGDGIYSASFTPEVFGQDTLRVTVKIGDQTFDINGSPTTITTEPRPVAPDRSSATVESTADVPSGGKVGAATHITILVFNDANEPYDYPEARPIDVTVDIEGANATTPGSPIQATYSENGIWQASYTPAAAGTDRLFIKIDGVEIPGSPFISEVVPLVGDLTVVVDITGGAPADSLPVYLYKGTDRTSPQNTITDEAGIATFPGLELGSYTVHLPKRDFDVVFSTMTQVVDLQGTTQTVTFDGNTLDLGPGVRVFRVKEAKGLGTGNAYQYMVGGRSWNSANNQVQGDFLEGVQGHLVDILSQGENDFVRDFFLLHPDLCPDVSNPEKKCKYKGWIGLSDDAVETVFEWTTGEETVYFNWPEGQTAEDQPTDRKGNLDHVEIGVTGVWGIVNGASSTNEGHFVEWDVEWPETPPFSS